MDRQASQTIQDEAKADGKGQAWRVCQFGGQCRTERRAEKEVRLRPHTRKGLIIDDARRDMIAGSIRRKEKDRKLGGQTVGHDTDVPEEALPAE